MWYRGGGGVCETALGLEEEEGNMSNSIYLTPIQFQYLQQVDTSLSQLQVQYDASEERLTYIATKLEAENNDLVQQIHHSRSLKKERLCLLVLMALLVGEISTLQKKKKAILSLGSDMKEARNASSSAIYVRLQERLSQVEDEDSAKAVAEQQADVRVQMREFGLI